MPLGSTAKRRQFLHELLPNPTVIPVLLDPNGPAFEAQLHDMGATARTLGRQIVLVKATITAFKTILQAAAGSLFVGSSTFFVSQRRKLVMFAAGHAVPFELLRT